MILLLMAALALSPVEGLALGQDPVPTEKEGEAAAHKLREEAAKSSIEGKIAALQEALKTEHEKVIKVVGEMLLTEADSVRIAAANALGSVDHPASAEVLKNAVLPNIRREDVMIAIFKAIGELGWQSAVPTLNELLPKVAEADIRSVLPHACSALGQLGSTTSVDPLIDLLEKLENGGRRNPWPNEGPLRRNAEEALREITGMAFNKAAEWAPWWRANQDSLRAKLLRVYWSRKTQDRVDVGPAEKTPADSVLVSTRLHPAKPEAAPAGKKKKKPK
jgi:hypothetical protein